jgi:hypothetical protein
VLIVLNFVIYVIASFLPSFFIRAIYLILSTFIYIAFSVLASLIRGRVI